MYKVTIIYPKNLEDDLLISIGKFGKTELIGVPVEKFIGFRKEVPTELHSLHMLIEFIERLAKNNGINLEQYVSRVENEVHIKLYGLGELQREFRNLEGFFAISNKIRDLSEKLSKLRLIRDLAKYSEGVLETLGRGFSTIVTFPSSSQDAILENLSILGVKFEIIKVQSKSYGELGLKDDTIALLSAPSRDFLSILLSTLSPLGVNEISLNIESIPRNLDDLEGAIGDLESEIGKLSEEFRMHFEENALGLAKLWYKANVSRKILTAKTMIARGEYVGVLSCWVPSDYLKELEVLLKKLNPNIVIRKEKPSDAEAPPSYVKIRGPLSPLASILRQMGYPGKDDIFPWLLASFLWAFMFGFMFPDIGQGLVLLIIGVLFANVKKIRGGIERLLGFSGKKAGAILMAAGVSATLFGILFGECFLIEIYHPLLPFLKEHWMRDMASIKWLIKMALLIGILEMLLAMLLFIYKNIKHKHYIEGILGEWALPGILMYIGLISFGLHFMGVTLLPKVTIPLINVSIGLVFEEFGTEVMNVLNPSKSWPIYLTLSGVGLFVLGGIIEKNLGERVSRLIEIPISIISNTLSFSRLAGFLIGHAAFSIIASKFKVMGTLTYVFGLVFLNLIVITLETIVVSLQALRLLLYEYSTKWYLGGGRPFRPFTL